MRPCWALREDKKIFKLILNFLQQIRKISVFISETVMTKLQRFRNNFNTIRQQSGLQMSA